MRYEINPKYDIGDRITLKNGTRIKIENCVIQTSKSGALIEYWIKDIDKPLISSTRVHEEYLQNMESNI